MRMGYDNKCAAAAMINLAVRGFLTINEDDGDYTLTRERDAQGPGLSAEEVKFAERLFAGARKLHLDNAQHTLFTGSIEQLKNALAKAYKDVYFHSNLRFFVPGVIISVVAMFLAALAGAVSGNLGAAFGAPFVMVWLSGWSVGVFVLVREAYKTWEFALRTKKMKIPAAGGALFLTLFSIPFVGGEFAALGFLIWFTSIWFGLAFVAIAAVNVVFYYLLRAPTVEGRKVMDDIEGFKMYLGTAEQDSLNFARRINKTPELFEKFLPYALAMDVENEWAEQFSEVLAKAAAGGYQPGWYTGSAWSVGAAAGFAASFGGSFSGALSSACTAPGSSSGGGGGGSSGGGGGGGGGGGW